MEEFSATEVALWATDRVQYKMHDIVLIDYETTGFAVGTEHEVVEIGAIRLTGELEEIASFTSVIRAEHLHTATPRAMEVHGISPREILAAPHSAEVWQAYWAALGLEGARVYYFAHNSQFDTRCHTAFRHRAGAGAGAEYIHCTSRGEIFRPIRVAMGKKGMISLRDVARHYGVGDSVEHRGLADVRLLAECIRRVSPEEREKYWQGVMSREGVKPQGGYRR